MMHESFRAGVFFMILSATGLALTGLLGKIGLQEMDLAALIFWRFAASLILCILIMWLMGDFKHEFTFRNYKLHLLRAVFVLTTQYCYYYYLERNTLLNAMVLINTGPLFIPIFERVFLHTKIGVSTWTAVIVSFIGALFVIQPNAGLFASMSWIGLVSGATQGASQVVFGINSKTERSDLGVLYLFFLCTVFSLIPLLFLERSGINLVYGGTTPMYWIVAGLGFASVFNQIFRAAAYRHATPSRLSCFMYISVVLAGIWDWLFFSIIPNIYSIIGACLVVAGGLLKIYLRYKILQKKE